MPTSLLAAITMIFAATSTSFAHDLPISNLTMVADKEFLHVEIVTNSTQLSFAAELDRNDDGVIQPREIRPREKEIAARILNFLTIQVSGKTVVADVWGIVPDLSSHHLTVRAHYPVDARRAPISLRSRLTAITKKAHILHISLRRPGQTQRARLDANSSAVKFDEIKP